MDSHLSCCSIMYYYVFFTPEPLNQGGGLRSHKQFPQQQKRCYVRVFPQVVCMMAYVLFMLLCLPFERRETYCFSLIFSSASASAASASSASSQRSHHNFFIFPDRSIIFGMWVHDHKAVCCIP